MIYFNKPVLSKSDELSITGETSRLYDGRGWVIYQDDEPVLTESLASFKELAYKLIDEHTYGKISNGFMFKGIIFSMSTNAQINWSNLLNMPENMFPLQIMSKNNEDVYILNVSDRANFYLASLTHKNDHLQVGNSRKDAVKLTSKFEDIKLLLASWNIEF